MEESDLLLNEAIDDIDTTHCQSVMKSKIKSMYFNFD